MGVNRGERVGLVGPNGPQIDHPRMIVGESRPTAARIVDRGVTCGISQDGRHAGRTVVEEMAGAGSRACR
jgi:hypothetical protein